MNKAITIIILIIIASVFAYGWNLAYGDFYEETIKLPIPDNITGQDHKKQLTELSDNVLEYTMTFRFYLGQNGTAWQDELLSEFGLSPPDVTLCPERFYLDEAGVTCYPLKDKPPSPEFIKTKPADLNMFEKKLQYYEEHPPTIYDQQDELYKLQELKECFEGLAQSRGIQNYGSFYTSGYDEILTTPKTGSASPLDIAIERCHAEATLLPILGDDRQEGDILSRQSWFGVVEVPHGERAIIDEEYWSVVPTQPDQASIHDMKDAEWESHEIICNSDRVTIQFKHQQVPPCTNEQLGITEDALLEMNDTGIGEGKQTYYRSGANNSSEGGGELPVNGWSMTPEAEWTEEQQVKCSGRDMQFPNAYERAICGTSP